MLPKTPCSILIPVLVLFVTSVLYVDGQTNNTLDTNGNIVWGQLAPDKQYKTTGYKADTGGLDPYYNLARSFINTSLPKKIPIGKILSTWHQVHAVSLDAICMVTISLHLHTISANIADSLALVTR